MLAIAMAVMIASAPMAALAQERAGDAALGAVSGALVFGPVGAVAGALVGYTAGPAISRSWGVKRSEPRPVKSPTAQTRQPSSKTRVSTQGARTPSASTQAAATSPSPTAPRSEPSSGVRSAMPPVQTLE
jgi:hypothetical protein